ncbi:hypothetical protein B0I26_102106 [Anoxybacillus vitaminiphilus]|uniref:YpoC-like domain-containing protein n=1 Tax=Paranoxybacillus vitaminiphilus TaxID=581036 RepID=A0A327YM92_9BACL|nr:hypothetical protein B0I26_102106 [Anoxybacillus vitaminiphilus]
MRVPSEFLHPLFYREGETIETTEFAPFPLMMKKFYFYYDIIACKENLENEPWNDIEQSIPAVWQLWNEEKEKLDLLFQNRDRKAAREPMIRALSYFLACLYWLNETRVKSIVSWEREVNTLQMKPVNCVERLQFIFAKCDLYHSFIQLGELFAELTKLYYKNLAIKKKGLSHQS